MLIRQKKQKTTTKRYYERKERRLALGLLTPTILVFTIFMF